MSIKGSECQVSKLVNSDTCPRPTTLGEALSDVQARAVPAMREAAPTVCRGTLTTYQGEGASLKERSHVYQTPRQVYPRAGEPETLTLFNGAGCGAQEYPNTQYSVFVCNLSLVTFYGSKRI